MGIDSAIDAGAAAANEAGKELEEAAAAGGAARLNNIRGARVEEGAE